MFAAFFCSSCNQTRSPISEAEASLSQHARDTYGVSAEFWYSSDKRYYNITYTVSDADYDKMLNSEEGYTFFVKIASDTVRKIHEKSFFESFIENCKNKGITEIAIVIKLGREQRKPEERVLCVSELESEHYDVDKWFSEENNSIETWRFRNPQGFESVYTYNDIVRGKWNMILNAGCTLTGNKGAGLEAVKNQTTVTKKHRKYLRGTIEANQEEIKL